MHRGRAACPDCRNKGHVLWQKVQDVALLSLLAERASDFNRPEDVALLSLLGNFFQVISLALKM